jgi:drug/metabolite transporter (DMT)-like permease
MAIVAPIAACGVSLPVLVGIATGDRPSTVASIGLPVAIVGVVLATREAAGRPRHGCLPRPPAARRAVPFALLAGAGIGAYLIFAEIGSRESVAWTLLLSRALATAILVVVVAAARVSVPRKPADLLALASIGILDLSATALYGLASTLGPLSLVAMASSLYPVVTVLLAAVLLGESLRRIQRLGVVLTLVGVTLIASG